MATNEASKETRTASEAVGVENARATSIGGNETSTAAIGPATAANKRIAAAGKKSPGTGRDIIESLPKPHRHGEAEER